MSDVKEVLEDGTVIRQAAITVTFKCEAELEHKLDGKMPALLRRAMAEITNLGNGYDIRRHVLLFDGTWSGCGRGATARPAR